MSMSFDGIAVSAWNSLITATQYSFDQLGMYSLLAYPTSSTWASATTNLPLDKSTSKIFYIRRDRRDRQRICSVFSSSGEKLYTFERKSSFSSVWSFIDVKSRAELATLRAGLVSRYMDFHNKAELQHRDLSMNLGMIGPVRRFSLPYGGGHYEWNRFSHYLEHVTYGDEEIRERVAIARHMRRFRLDYEVVVDVAKIDSEVALVTAFISMLTEWGLGKEHDTRGPTVLPKTKIETDIPSQDEAQTVDPLEIKNNIYLLMNDDQLNKETGSPLEKCHCANSYDADAAYRTTPDSSSGAQICSQAAQSSSKLTDSAFSHSNHLKSPVSSGNPPKAW